MRRLAMAVAFAAFAFSCGGSDERLVIATVKNNTLVSLDEVRVSFSAGSPFEEYTYDWTSEPRAGQLPGRGEIQVITIPIKNESMSEFTVTAFKDGEAVSDPGHSSSWYSPSLVDERTLNLVPEFSRQNGRSCSSSNGCASGFCVDGVCCNSACDGLCRRCDASGSCVVASSGRSDPGTCEAPSFCSSTGACTTPTATPGACLMSSDCRANQICIGGRCL